TRTGEAWPTRLTVRLVKRNPKDPADLGPKSFRMANGKTAFGMTFGDDAKTVAGKLEGLLELGKPWGEEGFLKDQSLKVPDLQVQVSTEGEALEIGVPAEMYAGQPESFVIEWGNAR
ncbi:MAG: hypothetical protein ACPG4K_05355, partial [Haloferula sp.]